MDTSYAPLHLRSNYSLFRGSSSIEAIIAGAARLKLPALALTDENNLYGAAGFFKAAGENGIKPVLGATISTGQCQAVLLVENAAGYANLCEIISRRNLEEGFSLAEALPALREGLFVLTEDTGLARELLGKLDKNHLFLELVRPHRPMRHQREILEAAGRLGIRPVASCDPYFAQPRDYALYEVLRAIGENALVDNTMEKVAADKPAYLRSPREMQELFSDCPEALANTLEIARCCDFDLLGRGPVFPKVPKVGGKCASTQLREKVFSRAPSRYEVITREVRRRLDYELGMICRMGFADYFLIVSDIVDHARALGTPTAGRGSGASSVVAYCLGITNIDALRYDISFERFLHEDRKDFPDLDIDFCWRLRDDVIDYVYRTYGDDHVAMIATYATLQPRLAFREVAKAFGISNSVITKVAKKIRRGLAGDGLKTLPVNPDVLEEILALSRRIEGFPHHLSVHCGGVVITPGPIRRHAPLQKAQKGVVITQYDKRGVEAVGLVKLDLLGNRSLSTIREAVDLVNESSPERLDPEKLPEGDEKTVRLLRSGDTLGCNQLESPAMRGLLRMLGTSDVQGIMKALAVIRPGAASLGMKECYVRRERGLEKPAFDDARLKRILGETHGIMVYEDDVLLVAKYIAGLPTGEADRLRRAITKCHSDEERLGLSRKFLAHCEKAGTGRALARDLWVQMAKFNHQSFCRGHAASYALLAYAVAYLKARHAREFWAAALNNNAGMYPRWVYVEEAKRSGIEVLLPCVNCSHDEFALEDGSVRTGLLRVAQLAGRSIEAIIEERKKGRFAGVAGFMARTRVQLREAENLVRCGAFDFTGLPRPALFYQLYSRQPFKDTGQENRLRHPSFISPACLPDLDAYTERKKFSDEWEILGLSARKHPLFYLGAPPPGNGLARSSQLAECVGRPVRLCGMLAATRVTHTAKGEPMEFLTLHDEAGVFEVTVFPGEYRRLRRQISGPGPYIVTGKVEDQYGALTVSASQIQNLRR